MKLYRRTTALLALSVSVFSTLAVAHGPTRQKVVETVEINAPAAQVWEVIKDFGTAHTWLPMVENTESEGGNVAGAKRTLLLGPDVKVYETLKKYNAEKMMYSYKIPNETHDVTILPVNNYSSTITVKDKGDTSEVIWKGAFYRGYPNNDPPPELSDEAAVAAVTGLYQAGLTNLKEMVEAQ
jgi:carbon monoxide dehydrogenase subunit G